MGCDLCKFDVAGFYVSGKFRGLGRRRKAWAGAADGVAVGHESRASAVRIAQADGGAGVKRMHLLQAE